MNMLKIQEVIRNNILKIETVNKWSIYGTGEGAEKIWRILKELGIVDKIQCVFDNDEKVKKQLVFHGFNVTTLKKDIGSVQVILVGAECNHREIYKRLSEFIDQQDINNVIIIDPFLYEVTGEDEKHYIEYLEKNYKKNEDYVTISDVDYVPMKGDSKIIAWYLPQFHQMEINNKYHGQGFTEWTNTTRVIPQFEGHYQPHIPYDVGYYDMMNPDTLKRQIWLAKKYGIYGFGFFYYWFSGKRIMEKPMYMLLEHKELDIPFCFHWATDDWSMSWYGGNSEVILKQDIPDAEKFWKDIAPFFADQRYIKIEGKPLLIVYKCYVFPLNEFKSFLEKIRGLAKKSGFPDLYIMISTGDGSFEDVDLWGGDALVEYQPWKFYKSKLIENVLPKGYINPNFKAYISDIRVALRDKAYLSHYDCNKYFRSALTSWDNSARKKESNAIVMWGNTPQFMKQWLVDIMEESKKIHKEEEDFVFISSWNEWAEGSHLEPDYKYGYAWLEAVREAIEECRKRNK